MGNFADGNSCRERRRFISAEPRKTYGRQDRLQSGIFCKQSRLLKLKAAGIAIKKRTSARRPCWEPLCWRPFKPSTNGTSKNCAGPVSANKEAHRFLEILYSPK